MRHTATDPRPPPPPWTGNPQTLAQLSTHTIGLRRWILARTATTTSAWTPSPRNPTSTRADKVATKTLLALRARCPPAPLLLLPCLGLRFPFPAPWDSMGPGRAVVMSREWEKEWWEWYMRVLEASDLQPVRHKCFLLTIQNVTDRTEFAAIPAFSFCSWNGHKHLKTGWNGTNDHE